MLCCVGTAQIRKRLLKTIGEKNRQDQFFEKLLKEYKGKVCICMVLSHTHIHIHTDTGQKFCATKAEFVVVVNFSGDRGEATEAEVLPLVLLMKGTEESLIPPSAVSPFKWPSAHTAS